MVLSPFRIRIRNQKSTLTIFHQANKTREITKSKRNKIDLHKTLSERIQS